MGGAVLADADGVVAEHEHGLGPRDGRQADRWAHVVEEDEERPTDREHAAVHRHPDARRTHGVLADPVVHLAAAGVVGGLLTARLGQLDAGVAGEVGGAGNEPWEVRHGRGEHLRHRLAGRDLLASLEHRQVVLPALGAGALPRGVPRGTFVGVERVERLLPAGAGVTATATDRGAIGLDEIVGRPERFVGDAHDGFGAGDVLRRERVGVGGWVVGVVGRRRADVRAQDEERRARVVGASVDERGFECVAVVADLAESLDAPAVGLEALDRRRRSWPGR